MDRKTEPLLPMRQKFRDICLELGERDHRLVLLFGDISVFLFREFSERYPQRFINAGICENTLITVAAGMNAMGYHTIVHTINPFVSERSLEQIKLDMGYNGFGGNIVTCGASFDYAWDGATHHSYGELATLSLIPGIEIMQPGNAHELAQLIYSQYDNGNTSYYRTCDMHHEEVFEVRFGKGIVVRDAAARDTVVTSGPLLKPVLQGCSDLPVNILYFHTLKPIDADLLAGYAHTRMLVVQDAHGLFESVCRSGARADRHGLPDAFIGSYGTADDIRRDLGLDARGIRERVQNWLTRA